MSYRNPRFCWRHLLRESAEIYDSGSSAVQAATPKERLWDDQAGRLCEFTASGTVFHRADLRDAVTATDHMDVNRILIPAGHNLSNDRGLNFRASAIGDFSDLLEIARADGMVNMHFVPWSGVMDGEFASGDDSNGFQITSFAGVTGENSKFGELWLTETRQPTTGVAHEWEDATEANLERADTRSGNTYTVEHGDPRRVFTLEHRALSGADADLYDELLSAVGYGVHPFWYEHPDSGTPLETLVEMGSTSGWTPANCTLALAEGSDGVASGALEVTASSGSFATVVRNLSGSEPTYFRGRLMTMDTFLQDGGVFITADDDLEIRVSTAATEAPASGQSRYSLARGLRTSSPAAKWVRTYFDLEDANLAHTVAGAVHAPDLGNVTAIVLLIGFTVGGQTVRFDEFNLMRKDRLPKLVELLGYERTQDSPAPLAGPTFRVRLRMREVLS